MTEQWLVVVRGRLWGVWPTTSYLAQESPRVWTRDPRRALHFDDVNHANEHAKETGASLRPVRLV